MLNNYETDYIQKLASLAAQSDLTGAQRLINYFDGWIETQRGSAPWKRHETYCN